MKHTIKHSCGHEQVHKLYGSRSDREWRISKLEQEPCAECAAKARAEFNAKKAKENAEAGLPELAGTPKQIAWAESIRSEKIKELGELRNYIIANANPNPEFQEMLANALKIIDDKMQELTAETSAAKWIDSRTTDFDLHWLSGKL